MKAEMESSAEPPFSASASIASPIIQQ
uniref:Uncharacterized protein n=1 Tax=Arundo donax TaxID=35708 RepID=A0A0A9HR45_ARUDO